MSYLISAESPMDLNFTYVTDRGVICLKYKYLVDEIERTENMDSSEELYENFYKEIENGKTVKQVHVSQKTYEEYFENLLENYDNVVHICFGSGVKKLDVVTAARDNVIKKYENKRLEIITTHCLSAGYGLLVEYACDFKDKGLSMDELIDKINDLKNRIEHYFFTTDPKFLNRSGKVSKKTTKLFKVLGLCPIFKLDDDGKLTKLSNGYKINKTIEKIIEYFKDNCDNNENYEGKCFISHSYCVEVAKDLKDQVLINFPMIGDVKIWDIGPTIGSYTGIGTIAIFFIK